MECMYPVTDPAYQIGLDNITREVGHARQEVSAAVSAGYDPMLILRTVCDAIGFDIKGIPPIMLNQVAAALTQAVS